MTQPNDKHESDRDDKLPELDSTDCCGLPCHSADDASKVYCYQCVRRAVADDNGMSYRSMNDLNGECIMLMRESLARVGIEAAFADDCAHNAAAYIFQLRAAIEEVIREDSGLMVVPKLRELLALFTPKKVEVTRV